MGCTARCSGVVRRRVVAGVHYENAVVCELGPAGIALLASVGTGFVLDDGLTPRATVSTITGVGVDPINPISITR
ncbi:MAG: hypothetical protein CMJ59_03715 [Planctomycetaceae bacterium]|nr:hypothetical protein [Planctomycetaceae bacterium]